MFINAPYEARKDYIVPNPSRYTHEPLNYTKGSIRLLRILPGLSDTGLIQCQIWHDTVDAAYTCLSYVWGSEKDQQKILINGKTFWIRKNLWDFLRVARTKYASTFPTFWIDALCIDQDLVEEKNHQVAQMGPIYSNAVEVIAWLGYSQGIGRALAYALEMNTFENDVLENNALEVNALGGRMKRRRISGNEDCRLCAHELWSNGNQSSDFQLEKDWLEVVNHDYWKRAWITQEILLARRITLLVDDMKVDAGQLSTMHRILLNVKLHKPLEGLKEGQEPPHLRIFKHYLKKMCGRSLFRDLGLIDLLHELPGRQCERPRDRIYSLLSIAIDSDCISVDYGSSDTDVLLHVARVFRRSMCVCFWFYLVNTFECRLGSTPEFGFRDRMPIFELPLSVANTELFMGPEPTDWYVVCSTCRIRTHDRDQTGYFFCLSKFCNGFAAGTHFSLKRYHTDVGQRHTVQRCDSTTELDVVRIQIEGGSEDDIILDEEYEYRFFRLFKIWLTADVLTRLLQHDTPVETPKAPVQVCLNARKGRGQLVYHNIQQEHMEDDTTSLSTQYVPIQRKETHLT
jgi:hypothetical protein